MPAACLSGCVLGLPTVFCGLAAALVFLLKERSTVGSTGSLLSFSAIEQQDVKKVSPSPLRLTNDLKINTGGKYSRVALKNTDTFFSV